MLLLARLLAAGLVLTSPAALAATWHVAPDGTGDAPTIQAAIDLAVDGDVVELANGAFTGTGNRDLDCSGKAITVRSQAGDPLTCILDCEGSPADPHRGFLFHGLEGRDTELRGVTIRNGYADKGGGIRCTAGTAPTIQECRFVTNAATYSGGALYSEGSGVWLGGCVFWANSALTGGAVDFDDASQPAGARIELAAMDRCTLVGNEATRGAGMDFEALGLTVSNTIVAFGVEGEGVSCFSGGDPVFTCCDVFGNAGGDALCGADGGGNFSDDPLFCNPVIGDFALTALSPCAPAQSGGCGLVGALPVECGPVGVEPESWGKVRGRYR